MGFGIRMMTKARAWFRAFFAPRRSRVVNPGEEEGLRNPSFSRRPRIAGSAGATRALRSRHDENDPVFDKIRQIHAFIPQIRAFFRQIQDPSERGKNIKSLKIKGLCEKEAPGGGISQGRGVCPHPPALAPRRHPAGVVRERPAACGANPSPKRAAREPPLRNRRQRRRRGRIYAPRLQVGGDAGRSPARGDRGVGRLPAHRPFHSGFRFSRKARNPSALSSVSQSAPWANFSSARPAVMLPSIPKCTMAFMNCGTKGA